MLLDRPVQSLLLISAFSSVTTAWELPLVSRVWPSGKQEVLEVVSAPEPDNHVRVAIIGAGAGGSSAAFWIAKAKERHGLEVLVDVFDKASYIGGRSTTIHPYDDPELGTEELGASIFVNANKNLMRATKEFNLTLTDLAHEDAGFAIWDGKQFLITIDGTWWDAPRVIWRYGIFAANRVKAAVNAMVNSLDTTYTPGTHNTWRSVEELSEMLGFSDIHDRTADKWYDSKNINPKFTRELIEGATRVNYCQDIDQIHGLGGAVSMAANGASQVEGGNFQIFEGFLKHSDAQVHLGSTITSLTKTTVGDRTKWHLDGSHEAARHGYDHVILTAPIHNAGITLKDSSATFPPVEYVRLHVTILSTTSFRPLSSYFGINGDVPRTILTSAEGVRNGGPAPEFNSVSYHRTITLNGQEEHIFKIFSVDRKSHEWLEDLFGAGTIGWVYRKEWDSYPKLPPTSTFPAVKPDTGLWYVNSLEPWVSTMETETLSARNVVDLLLQETFGAGICYADGKGPIETEGDDQSKVYGWDC
ncbi:hypothetical protein FRC03_007347 [Tulasnella sp. 419]|nr:hypothetical protein FRC03_007347 [Tulasnella sp. 419]